jgi:hypothetical protein
LVTRFGQQRDVGKTKTNKNPENLNAHGARRIDGLARELFTVAHVEQRRAQRQNAVLSIDAVGANVGVCADVASSVVAKLHCVVVVVVGGGGGTGSVGVALLAAVQCRNAAAVVEKIHAAADVVRDATRKRRRAQLIAHPTTRNHRITNGIKLLFFQKYLASR